MFGEIFRFEVRFQLRRHLTYICAILFFLMAFGAVASDWVQMGGAIGSVNRNAPFVIMQIMVVLTLVGVFVTTAFVAGTVQRDGEWDVSSLFYSLPITKWDYLGGRFIGALVVATIPFLATALGVAVGGVMPWLEPERVGAFALWPYLFSFVTIVIPNVLLPAALFFAVATLTRNMLFTYVTVVLMFMGYGIAQAFLGDIENQFLAGLIDPFGLGAFSLATQYWTVVEKNTLVLSLTGAFLWNRILWTVVSAAVFAYTFRRFRFELHATRFRRPVLAEEEISEGPLPMVLKLRDVAKRFTLVTTLHQFVHELRREFVGIVKGAPFIVLVLFAVINMASFSLVLDQFYGTTVFLVTSLLVDVIDQNFELFLFIVITFYAGDLVWKERVLKLGEVRDALPTHTWVSWGAKLAALIAAVLLILGGATLTGIVMQVWSGFFDVEVALYLKGVFANLGVEYVLLAVLAFFVQVATNNKYLGYLVMVVYFVSILVLPALDFEHRLYQYGIRPEAPYSDMNKYGHFVTPTVWFSMYWGLMAVLLLALTHLFWVRTTDPNRSARWAVARQRWNRTVASLVGVGAVGFAGVGGFIYYNTNVLNRYETGNDQADRQASFEKQYKQYDGLAQPRITDVYADVRIDPPTRSATVSGRYTLRNKTDAPIHALHVRLNPDLDAVEVGLPGVRLEHADTTLGYYIYRLDRAFNPGDSMIFGFELAIRPEGFVNSGSNTDLVYNGTFFNNFDYFPHLGYSRAVELTDPNERRKHGLPPVERMPPLSDDPADRANTYISTEADWVNFETVVSTSVDQIAIAPGYLQREWVEGGRRFFHYKMDAPILNFYAFLSADYTVLRDRWNDVDIEIFYHQPHEYNLSRMVESIKESLAYFSTNFSPYQHRQVRILEFPRYATFAQAFPNTVPYSEGLGFIARIDDEEDVDYVFYVTAHEVGHQWWAHQVIGANMQGATVMSETMAQYSALMVMEREYGRDKMRRFLRYELDQYLQGRSGETIEELPLMYVENQGYIHYRKGSLVMYALRDYIGEENLNAALARYIDAVAFQDPPYTNSREFVSYLREATPDSLQYVIEDMFETITLYDNHATDVMYTARDDGTYRVTMSVDARKLRADGKGVETEIPVRDWIDIGVFGDHVVNGRREETVLYLQKHHITENTTRLEFVVDAVPVRGGIDPYHKLIDRQPDDNVRRAREST